MIVYTKHPCTKCDFTIRLLDKMGAKYEPREFDEEALKLAQSKGITSAPLVVVGDVVWGDLRTDLIKQYAIV
jgi:glutaredoxin